LIRLIVADPMQAYRRIRCDHEIECGAGWPTINEWWREPSGCSSLFADKCHTHESAGGARLQF
jgi:hypothetical protein